MTADLEDNQTKRNALILERLRAAFGEEREGEWSDIDGLGLFAIFLRPIGQDGIETRGLNRADLAEWRRRRRAQRQSPDTQSLSFPADPPGRLAQYAALIEELPQLRAEFAEWLAGVETDGMPTSSNLDELKTLYARAEYRLRVLNLMLNETQRELDALRIAIRAAESQQPTQ